MAPQTTPGALLMELRRATPLVHCITNYVAMNVAANVLLAVGASPAMVHAAEEAEEFAGIAGALTVNIGTLSSPWLDGTRSGDKPACRSRTGSSLVGSRARLALKRCCTG